VAPNIISSGGGGDFVSQLYMGTETDGDHEGAGRYSRRIRALTNSVKPSAPSVLTCCTIKQAHYDIYGARGGVVIKALRYKPAGRGFDSRWCH
jgi:hypothetical protein